MNFYSVLRQTISVPYQGSPVEQFYSALDKVPADEQQAFILSISALSPTALPIASNTGLILGGVLAGYTTPAHRLISLVQATANSDDPIAIMEVYQDLEERLPQLNREGAVDKLFGLFRDSGAQIDRVIDFLKEDDGDQLVNKVDYLLALRQPIDEVTHRPTSNSVSTEALLNSFFDFAETSSYSAEQLSRILTFGEKISRDQQLSYIDIVNKLGSGDDFSYFFQMAKELGGLDKTQTLLAPFSYDTGAVLEVTERKPNRLLNDFIQSIADGGTVKPKQTN